MSKKDWLYVVTVLITSSTSSFALIYHSPLIFFAGGIAIFVLGTIGMYRTPAKPMKITPHDPKRWPVIVTVLMASLALGSAYTAELGHAAFAIAFGILGGIAAIGVLFLWIWYADQK